MIELAVRKESWPIRGTFTISRGSKTEAEVVLVELRDGAHLGRGECVPYRHYNETVDGVAAAIENLRSEIAAGLTRDALQTALPAGAARNALDCAYWDLAAKKAGRRVWELAGLTPPVPMETAYTISAGPPEKMSKDAAANRSRPVLKLKLAGPGDLDRVAAVRKAAPETTLVVDANEAWTADQCRDVFPALAALDVAMIEQPLPAGQDSELANMPRPIPVCADESAHVTEDLDALVGKYDMVNLKLDKTGGLTEALRFAGRASDLGFDLMVGCMVGTSLAMAPATLLAPQAKVVDLDGPLLLARDRDHALDFTGNRVHPPLAELWG